MVHAPLLPVQWQAHATFWQWLGTVPLALSSTRSPEDSSVVVPLFLWRTQSKPSHAVREIWHSQCDLHESLRCNSVVAKTKNARPVSLPLEAVAAPRPLYKKIQPKLVVYMVLVDQRPEELFCSLCHLSIHSRIPKDAIDVMRARFFRGERAVEPECCLDADGLKALYPGFQPQVQVSPPPIARKPLHGDSTKVPKRNPVAPRRPQSRVVGLGQGSIPH